MKVEVIIRDYDGQKFVKYTNSDGYHMMKLGKHGKLDDVMGEELDAIDALLDHAEQQKIEKEIQKAKLDEDAEKQKMAHEFYAPAVPLILNNDYLTKIAVDDKQYNKFINSVIEGKEDAAKDELEKIMLQKVKKYVLQSQIEEKAKSWFPPNMLVNESTGEVTYDYVSEEQKRQWPQPQFKKDADPPKKKQKEQPKPEPKPEYGEAINITKKKSRWERFTDRIIKNIVWGK